MRAIVAVLIVLALALAVVGTSPAAPGADVKSSPLFKRSLEESIASLEGKVPDSEAAAMPTGQPGCPTPNLPWTQSSTCQPSVCGGSTCGDGTCQGQVTCYNTCGTTCSGSTCTSTCASTCANTCSGTSCSNYCAQGYVKYYGSQYNWSGHVNRKVVQWPLAQRWTNFNQIGYYLLTDIGPAGQWLMASACNPSNGLLARGQAWRPPQGPPGTYWLDINTVDVGACP